MSNRFKSTKSRKFFFANKTPSKSNSVRSKAYEREAINKSIKEEQKAQRDYDERADNSKTPKVKKQFKHLQKEEHTHEKELKTL